MYSESKDFYGAGYSNTTSSNPNDLTKVLIGALAGAAAGSVIAVLFTEKGIEARKRVSEGSKNITSNIKDKVSDITDNLKDKVTDITDNIKDKVSDVTANLANKYDSAKESAANLIEKGKQKVGISADNYDYKSTAGADSKGIGSKVLLGALAVSVAGSLVWIFATEKGSETRKRVSEGSKNIASELKEKFADIGDEIADTYEAAKEGAADLLEKAKQQMDMPEDSTAYKGSTGAEKW